MPIKDDPTLGPIPTVPDNLDQPPKFGGITELVKDVFALELRHFLQNDYKGIRSGEFPRVEKYQVALDVNVDPLATAVNLVRNYPDVTENLPLVAVMAATGQNFKLSISDKHVGLVIKPAEVRSNILNGPYTLVDGQTLILTTQPTGLDTKVQTSTYTFHSYMFSNISQATLDEVIAAIELQALYAKPIKAPSNSDHVLALRAGGPNGREFPNKITITGGTAMAALGFTANQTAQNYGPGIQAYSRNCMSANLTVGIEVVAESENVRTDLTDIIYDFFAFIMADRQFQFYGRTIFDDTVLDETYQILIKDGEVSISGEQELPRNNDPKDKIYVNRINVPVTAIQYTDRIVTDQLGNAVTPIIKISTVGKDTLPQPN